MYHRYNTHGISLFPQHTTTSRQLRTIYLRVTLEYEGAVGAGVPRSYVGWSGRRLNRGWSTHASAFSKDRDPAFHSQFKTFQTCPLDSHTFEISFPSRRDNCVLAQGPTNKDGARGFLPTTKTVVDCLFDWTIGRNDPSSSYPQQQRS